MRLDKPFFEVEGTILKAQASGFYKIKGLASKSGICRHVSCGATSPTYCQYQSQKKEYDQMVATGKTYYGAHVSPSQIASSKGWMDQLAAAHPTCTKDWCVKSYGPRPNDLGEKIKCTRIHLEAYTDQELADPNVRPESVAISMSIALQKSHEVEYGIALYDLIDDKWFNDQWWTTTGWKSSKLMPHKHADWPAPKKLALIDNVIASLKENL